MEMSPVKRHSLITLISTISITTIGFVSTMYFAHTLGASILGAYFLFLAYFEIFDLIGDGGIGKSAVKRISEGVEQSQFFSAFVILRLIFFIFSMGIVLCAQFVIVPFRQSGYAPFLLIGLFGGLIFSLTSNAVYGSGKVGVYQISSFSNFAIKVIVQIFAVALGYGFAGLAGGFIAGLFAAGLINFKFLSLKFSKFSKKHIKSMFDFSFWIFLSTSGSLIFAYADTILIGFYLGNYDVGIYRTAFQFTSIATFSTITMYTVLYPKISNWGTKGDIHAIQTALTQAFTYSLLLAVPVCIGGWILGDKLLYYLYGASFAAGALTLSVLLIVQVMNVFMYLQTMCLNALDHPKEAFKITLIGLIINIVLDIILIPRIGYIGAAYATLITIMGITMLSYRTLSSLIHVTLDLKAMKNILFSAIVMGIIVLILRVVLPLSHAIIIGLIVLLGGILYFGILFKLDKEIFNEFKDIFQGLGIVIPSWLW